jgi:lysophospholipase L1-like esterase
MRSNLKTLVIISIILFSIIASFALLEAGARVIWKKKYNQWLETQLHGFEYIDYNRSIIIPKANTTVTVENQGTNLETHGKTIGLKNFQETVRRDNLSGPDILFSINKYGFRGPEITIPKPRSIFRILTIGDSCTWGAEKDYDSYPRVMERELNNLTDEGFKFEVVNAGVMGYNFERVIKRIDDFLEVEPDLIMIYLGWNQTIGRADPRKNSFLYRSFALYKIYYHFMVNRASTGLAHNYNTKTTFETSTPFINELEKHSFSYDMQDLDYLIKKISRKRKDTRIVIITLAGLFDSRVVPDKRALEIGYPTESTNNLYAYALLTKKYNDKLREYAKQHNLNIIDFEEYAFAHFIPRSTYFHDSVHPEIVGYMEMGEYFASEIIRINKFKMK